MRIKEYDQYKNYGTHHKQIDPEDMSLCQVKAEWNGLQEVSHYNREDDECTRCVVPACIWGWVIGSATWTIGGTLMLARQITHPDRGLEDDVVMTALMGPAAGTAFLVTSLAVLYFGCRMKLGSKRGDIKRGQREAPPKDLYGICCDYSCCIDPTTLCPEKKV